MEDRVFDNRRDRRSTCADVAELADALDSGSSSRKGVEVQVLSSAPIKSISYRDFEALRRRASLVLWDSVWDSFENLSHSSPTRMSRLVRLLG
jgi:hypothetical protein